MIVRLPAFLRLLYPGALSCIPAAQGESPVVYLTFDDGPIPEVTPWVVRLLNRYGIKATFFVVADNVRKHPDIYELLCSAGHEVGNHTYHHLQGIRVSTDAYLQDTDEAADLITSQLFRPPHGLLTPVQYHRLQRHYQVVLWDVLSRDFDPRLGPSEVLANVQRYARNGSIIVFHDSLKAQSNLYAALPQAIEWCLSAGYRFAPLSEGIAPHTSRL